MERLVGRDAHRIDYRHIIHALVRKPGAFRRYVFREALFPSLEFRRAYDALLAEGSDQADLDYVRILHPGCQRWRRSRSCRAGKLVARRRHSHL
jgi:hypothetical protein